MGNSSSQESDDGQHQRIQKTKGKKKNRTNRDTVTQADLQKVLDQLSGKTSKSQSKNVTVDREQWEQILKLKPQLEALAKMQSPGAHITQSQWDQFEALQSPMGRGNPSMSHTTIRTDILQQNPPVPNPFSVPPPPVPHFYPAVPGQQFPHPNPQSTGAIPRINRGGPANRGPKRGNKNNPDGPKKDDFKPGQGQQKGENIRGRGRGRGRGGVPVTNDLVDINPGVTTSHRGRGRGQKSPAKKNNDTDWVVVSKDVSSSEMGAKDFIDSMKKPPNNNLLENTTDKVVIKKKKNKKLNNEQKKEEVTSDFVATFIKNNIGNAVKSDGEKQEYSPEFMQQMVASCTEYFASQMNKVLTEKPAEEIKPVEKLEPLPSKMNVDYVKENFLKSEIPDEEVRKLLPSHWLLINFPVLKQHITVELDPNSMDFVELSNLFHKSVNNELKIESIHRIENAMLWYLFTQRKTALTELFGGTKPEEKYLFHGTAAKNMDTILENGFGWYDQNKPQPKKFNFRYTLTPFARSAVQHCKVDHEGKPKRIFVAHVLQGTQETSKDSVEDLLTGDDDVTNWPSAARIYRILDEHGSYPAFYITFTGEIPQVQQRHGKQ